MTDPRTKEYLKQLAKTVECAEEICQCSRCSVERLKKQITADDKDRVLQYLGRRCLAVGRVEEKVGIIHLGLLRIMQGSDFLEVMKIHFIEFQSSEKGAQNGIRVVPPVEPAELGFLPFLDPV